MITAGLNDESLVRRLTAKARKLGEARAEARFRHGREDPTGWRRAGLLWPLIGPIVSGDEE